MEKVIEISQNVDPKAPQLVHIDSESESNSSWAETDRESEPRSIDLVKIVAVPVLVNNAKEKMKEENLDKSNSSISDRYYDSDSTIEGSGII